MTLSLRLKCRVGMRRILERAEWLHGLQGPVVVLIWGEQVGCKASEVIA